MKKDAVSEHVRLVIRRLRMERGLRVRDVAERAGIPMGSYSGLETGRYKIGTDNLFRILHVLGVPVSQVWPKAQGKNGPAAEVSKQYIERVVAKARRRQPSLPSVENAVEAVCQVYGLTLEELSSPSRERRLAEARTVASMLVEREPHLTKDELSRLLQRDPSTLAHCARRLRKRLAGDAQLEARIEQARALFGELKRRRQGPQREAGRREVQPVPTPRRKDGSAMKKSEGRRRHNELMEAIESYVRRKKGELSAERQRQLEAAMTRQSEMDFASFFDLVLGAYRKRVEEYRYELGVKDRHDAMILALLEMDALMLWLVSRDVLDLEEDLRAEFGGGRPAKGHEN